MRPFFIFLFVIFSSMSYAQNSRVMGRVFNEFNNLPLEFAKVQVLNMQKGAITDEEGRFEIIGLPPGVYSFKAVFSGYEDLFVNEISVTKARVVELNFGMEELVQDQDEVIVKASPFLRKKESPVSLKTLNATEIERLPGANRDVSKVIAALPGVASRATFRNDIIIRGGSPGENKFYLDGIEVPNINHFATQGSSGGPVGLLNVNFVREVDFLIMYPAVIISRTGQQPAIVGTLSSVALRLLYHVGKQSFAGTIGKFFSTALSLQIKSMFFVLLFAQGICQALFMLAAGIVRI